MRRLLIVIMLLPLLGCAGRVIDWARDTVYQGTVLPNFSDPVKAFLRSIAIYDQFETKAVFDSLWLAEPVRISYAKLYATKYGLNDEQYDDLVRRQLAENDQCIFFYLLSLYEVPLKEQDGDWSLFLEVDGMRLTPVEIKAIDLGPEYISFFGKTYSRFKVPYIVKFAAHDSQNNSFITSETKTISLVFRSITKEVRIIWDVQCLQKIPAAHQSGCCVKQ